MATSQVARTDRLVKEDAMDKPDAMVTSHAAQEEARHGDNRHPLRSQRLPPMMEDWDSVMNAEGIRRCVEEKEAAAATRDQLAAHAARLEKECGLYERDLERAMESCDELARESDDLRKRLREAPDGPQYVCTNFWTYTCWGRNIQQFHQAEAQVVEPEGHEPGCIEAAAVPLAAKLPRLQGAQKVNPAGR